MVSDICKRAKETSRILANLSTTDKNNLLERIAQSIDEHREDILTANQKDMENGKANGLAEGLLDRLMINNSRIDQMLISIRQIKDLEDPVGEVLSMKRLENNLMIGKKRVPMGVIAIIYESRPNVTVDCAALCLKTSNSLVLRGGKEAIFSNIALTNVIRAGISACGYPEDFVQIIEDTSHDGANELMGMKGLVDLLIPRGSKRLIQTVVDNAKVPVLETGVGNCHVYVDTPSNIEMACSIIENAKTQRIGVCNAMESLLVQENIEDSFFQSLQQIIDKHSLQVVGCDQSRKKLSGISPAIEDDYAEEYLDYKFSMKIVKDVDEAISHINK